MGNRVLLGISSLSALLLVLCFRRKVDTGGNKKRKLTPRKSPRSRRQITEDDVWNTVLFFPDYFPDDHEQTTTKQLIWYLDQATGTVDVCMYGFAFQMLQQVVIRLAKERGVTVRILTNSPVHKRKLFLEAGIQCRCQRHIWKYEWDRQVIIDLMHHKFVVIDGRAALAGSLNWTWPSITENNENVVITTQPKIVGKLSQEFERVWKDAGGMLATDEYEAEKWINGESRGVQESG